MFLLYRNRRYLALLAFPFLFLPVLAPTVYIQAHLPLISLAELVTAVVCIIFVIGFGNGGARGKEKRIKPH